MPAGQDAETLYPGRGVWIALALVSTIFLLLALWLLYTTASWEGIGGLIIFGGLLVISVRMMRSKVSSLTIASDHFRVRHLGLDWSFAYDDVSAFSLMRMGRNNYVSYQPLADGAPDGEPRVLPDCYGLTADALAAKLNARRDIAATRAAGTRTADADHAEAGADTQTPPTLGR